MTTQAGQLMITTHILTSIPPEAKSPTTPNISRSKPNQAIKFGQFTEIAFLKNLGENETGRLVPDLFLFFKKAL